VRKKKDYWDLAIYRKKKEGTRPPLDPDTYPTGDPDTKKMNILALEKKDGMEYIGVKEGIHRKAPETHRRSVKG